MWFPVLMKTRLIYCRKKLSAQYEACVDVEGLPYVFPVDARMRDKFRDDATFHRWIERTAVALNGKEYAHG